MLFLFQSGIETGTATVSCSRLTITPPLQFQVTYSHDIWISAAGRPQLISAKVYQLSNRCINRKFLPQERQL